MEGLGFFGILGNSGRILYANRKYFFLLSASLLLPLSFLSLFSSIWLGKIIPQQMLLAFSYMNPQISSSESPEGLPTRNAQLNASRIVTWSNVIFFISYVGTIMLGLVSTVAVAQSVCRGYFDRKLALKGSLTRVPKALPGLIRTAVCMSVATVSVLIAVTILAFLSMLFLNALKFYPTIVVVCITIVVMFIYLTEIGVLVYLAIIWSLAYVTSALEENGGWEALRRSSNLVKGQRWRAFGFLVMFSIVGSVVGYGMFYKVIENSDGGTTGPNLMRLLLGAIAQTPLLLYELAVITVFYIQCKIYHNESMDALPCLRRPGEEFDFTDYKGSEEELDFSEYKGFEYKGFKSVNTAIAEP